MSRSSASFDAGKWGMLIAAAAWLALTPAHALTITNDHGGFIDDYIARYKSAIRSHEPVIVDGACNSACTMVLAVPHVCATSRARFGFHRAYTFDRRGREIDAPDGTAALMITYPSSVRAWLARHGGLTRKMKYASGAALGIRRCR